LGFVGGFGSSSCRGGRLMAGLDDLASLLGLGGGAQPAPAPALTPAAGSANPSGATVLATLQPALRQAAVQMQNPPQRSLGLGDALAAGAGAVPNVRGMSNGSAAATGLAAGIQAGQQAAQQQAAENRQAKQDALDTFTKLFGVDQAAKTGARADQELAIRQREDQRAAAAADLANKSAAIVPDPENPGQMKVNPVAVDAKKQMAEAGQADEYGNRADVAINVLGMTKGSPEFKSFVAESKLPPDAANRPLNATEEKLLQAEQKKIDFLSQGLSALEKAKALATPDPKTGKSPLYTGMAGGALMKLNDLTGGNLPGVDQNAAANSGEFENLLGTASMSQGKEFFGGKVSNYEERLLQDLRANLNQSPTKAIKILDDMIEQRRQALQSSTQMASQIKSGEYAKRGVYVPTYYPYEKLEAPTSPVGTPAPAPEAALPNAAPPNSRIVYDAKGTPHYQTKDGRVFPVGGNGQ
jgi:hypothetical protein